MTQNDTRLPAAGFPRFGAFLVLLIAVLPFPFPVRGQTAAGSGKPAFETVVCEPSYDQPWRITSYVVEDALKGKHFTHLDFDKNGNVWVSSAQGLWKYDGYSWEQYTASDGLPSLFCRCVTVLENGTLWVGTDKGAVRWDPITKRAVEKFGVEDGLAGPSVRRIVPDADGNLWFCCDLWPDTLANAGLTRRDVHGVATTWRTTEGLPSNHIMTLGLDNHGGYYALTSKGVAKLGKDGRWSDPWQNARGAIPDNQYRLFFAEKGDSPDNHFLFASFKNMVMQKNGRLENTDFLGLPEGTGRITRTKTGEIAACSIENEGSFPLRFYLWEPKAKRFTVASAPTAMKTWSAYVEEIREAPDGAIWAFGIEVLCRWERRTGVWTEYRSIPPPLFVDPQERIWFDSDNEGDNRKLPAYRFERKTHTWQRTTTPVGHLVLQDDRVWEWNGADIRCWTDRGVRDYEAQTTGFSKIDQLAVLDEKRILALGERASSNPSKGKRRQQLLMHYDNDVWAPFHPDELINQDVKRFCVSDDGTIWLLTLNTENQTLSLIKIHGGMVRIIPLDVRIKSPFELHLQQTIEEDATPYILPFLEIDRNKKLYIYGSCGVFVYDDTSRVWSRLTDPAMRYPVLMADIGQGIWAAGNRNFGDRYNFALLLGDGRWKEFPTKYPCMSPEPSLWRTKDFRGALITTSGAFVIPGPTESDATPYEIVPPVKLDVNGAVVDGSGHAWIGIRDQGVMEFLGYPEPPRAVAQLIDTQIRSGHPIRLSCLGVDKFRPTDPSKPYLFSWRIDDGLWSDFAPSLTRIETRDLAGGPHVLEIRVWNEDPKVHGMPASIDFRILPIPLQEQPWFPLSALAAVFVTSASAIFALLARKRVLRQAEHLEDLVDVRTKELQISIKSAEADRDAAETANRVKTEFLANMSHELLTPLNAVIGLSDILVQSHTDLSQRELPHAIKTGGETLARLIHDILDYTELESGDIALQPRVFDLRSLLEESVDRVGTNADAKGLTIFPVISHALPEKIVGDEPRIKQILDRLLFNALKFTEHGHVILRADLLENEAGPTVQFSVEDTGIGIPPEKLRQLFQMFSQADSSFTRKHGGAGLGLAICKRLIECMGGSLHVESQVGVGSRFQFSIRVDIPTNADADAEVSPVAGKRILLVDNHDLQRASVAALLQFLKADVVETHWNDFPTHSALDPPPDLIITAIGSFPDAALQIATAQHVRNNADPNAQTQWFALLPRGRNTIEEPIFDAMIRSPVFLSELIPALNTPPRSTDPDHDPNHDPDPTFPDDVLERQTQHAPKESYQFHKLNPNLGNLHPLKILLAEDYPANQLVIKTMLAKLGYDILIAEDGLGAIQSWEEYDPDIILMDLQMPNLSGLEATRRIRLRSQTQSQTQPPSANGTPRRPWISALTANSSVEDQRACHEAGMDWFLAKPVYPENILDALKQALDHFSNQNSQARNASE